MARYIPLSRRRRNAALVAVATLLVGIAFGWLLGKQSAPSVGDAVADVQQQGETIAVQLERLPIEYEQTVNGSGEDTVEQAVLAPLDDLQAGASQAFERAPWISPAARAGAQDAIAEVRQAAGNGVSADEFEATVDDAAVTIRVTFGLDPGGLDPGGS